MQLQKISLLSYQLDTVDWQFHYEVQQDHISTYNINKTANFTVQNKRR